MDTSELFVQVRVASRLVQQDKGFTVARGATRSDVIDELQALQTATPKAFTLKTATQFNTTVVLNELNSKDDLW